MMGFGMGFGLVGLVLMVFFWGGLILLAVWLVKALVGNNSGNRPPSLPEERKPTALEILAQRYARGEITREQYELMREDLNP